MFGIGVQELAIVLVIALLVFGPKRLPELARTMGKGLAEFRRASSDLRQSLNFDLENEQRPPPPATPPRPAQAGDLELPTNSDAIPEPASGATPSDSDGAETARPTEADALNAAEDPHRPTGDPEPAADGSDSAADGSDLAADGSDPAADGSDLAADGSDLPSDDSAEPVREKSPVASGD